MLKGNDHWHMDEIKVLCDNYRTKPVKWIARKIGRTTSAIQTKAQSIGLRKYKIVDGSYERI